MIAAPYRNQGLGEEAMRWLEGELARQRPPISRLRAGVQVNNPGAIRFWQRMGFTIISGAELLPDGTTCYQLKKNLRKA
jgi:ribosomal protein S18 acetylase RimI-like enzyme